MSSFNVDEYFANRSKATTDIQNKLKDLAVASEAKIQQLSALKTQAQQRVQQASNTWAGKLGLDPDGFAGGAVNVGASVVSGASRLIGDVVSLPESISSENTYTRDETNLAAFNRFKAGQATQFDELMLNTVRADGRTVLGEFEDAERSRKGAVATRETFNLQGIVDQGNRQEFSQTLQQGFTPEWEKIKNGTALEKADGVANLLLNTGSALLSNKQAVLEYIAENAPQLAVGVAGKVGKGVLTASNIGYAVNEYHQGIDAYAKANNGQLPPPELQREMAAWASSLALAENVGDLALLKGIKGATATDAALGMGGRLKEAAGTVAKGFGTEALTEGYQTFAEGQTKLQPSTAEQIYEGAVIGGAAGGGLSAVGAAAGVLSSGTPAKPSPTPPDIASAFEAAASTGDVSRLVDPKSPSYDPAAAISALASFSAQEGTAPEVREAKLAEAAKVLESLEQARDALKGEISDATPEGIAELEKLVSVLQANGDPDGVAAAQEGLDVARAAAADLPALQARLKALEDSASQASENLARFNEVKFVAPAASSPEIDLDAEIDAVRNAPTSEARKAAADQVITLSMAAPQRVTVEQITAILGNVDLNLSAPQTSYLRLLAASKTAENALKTTAKVNQDILDGGVGFKGLTQYRREFATAMAAGSKALAERALAPLTKFANDHSAKAAAIKQAQEEFVSTRQPVQVIRGQDPGSWQINRGAPLDAAAIKASGAFVVSEQTPKTFVPALVAEAEAVSTTAAEMRAAIALKFEATKRGSANVQNVSESREASASAPQQGEASQEPASTEAVGETGSQGTSVPVGGESLVRGDGVNSESAVDLVEQPVQASTDAVTAEGTEGQTQSTENTSTNPDGVVPSKGTAEQSEPALSVMKLKSPEGTPFNERNLVADYFVLARDKALASIKDLFSSLLGKSISVKDLIKDELTDKQKDVVKAFFKKVKDWDKDIRANLYKSDRSKFLYDDLIQFLLVDKDGKPDLDENVKVAMTYAAFSWLSDQASQPRFLSSSAINSILGKDSKAYVPHWIYSKLKSVGVYQHVAVESLGGQVLDVLGLKSKNSAGQELEPKLRVALGLHALKLLEDRGLVTRSTITNKEMSGFRGKAESQEASGLETHTFFAIARDEKGKLVTEAREIYEASKGTKGVLGKLFSAEQVSVLPSFAPITEVQATTSGTKQELPTELKGIITANQAKPWKVKQVALALLETFSEEQIDSLIGVKAEDPATVHKANWDSVEAKNAGLRREYANFVEWVKEHLDTTSDVRDSAFYLPFNVWRQQRVGIDSNVVNPQTSKIVRFLIGSPDWKATIDPNNEEQITSFWLRVGEAMGVKTERQDNTLSVTEVQEKISDPVYQTAIAALVKAAYRGKELSAAEKQSIADAVAKGGENLHTLDALLGLASMEAKRNEEGKLQLFDVEMMGEVDGVANGTMLNHVLMGAGTQAMLNQGGFFELGSKYSQYNGYRGTPGNFDIYESTAEALYNQVTLQLPPGTEGGIVAGHIWTIAGRIFDGTKVTKEGRNLIKGAMNPLAFGSSLNKMVQGMSESFVEEVYAGFEKLAKKPNEAELANFVTAINGLLPDNKKLPVNKPIDYYMGVVLDEVAEAALMKKFSETVGEVTKTVVENKFSAFLARRDELNKAANFTYELYDSVYKGMREALIKELIAKGEVPVNSKGGLIGDLTKQQEAELQKRLAAIAPVIETSMSQKDSRNTGLLMAKQERVQNRTTPYANESKFGRPIKERKQKSTRVFGSSTVTIEPGVNMGSGTTHALDSGISHRTQKAMHVLNIHDAVGAGVGGLADAARLMNKNTWDALLNYSPLEAVHQSLVSVVEGIAAMQARGELSPEALANLADFQARMAEKYEAPNIKAFLLLTKQRAFASDAAKLQLMKNWAFVDQYAYQGGNYEVTDKDRDEAAAKEKAILSVSDSWEKSEVAKKSFEAAESLVKAVASAKAADKTTAAANVIDPQDVISGTQEEFEQPGPDDQLEPEKKASPFGTLGKPAFAANARLLKFFSTRPVAKATDLIKVLEQILGEQTGPNATLMQQLLPLLASSLPKGQEVVFVTKDTNPADVGQLPKISSYGWFNIANGKVFVLSDQFETSKLTPELMVHELIHAALQSAIANPGKDSALVDELNELMAQAKTFVSANGLSGFENALADVQEFVAWGLTNQAFQRQVLTQISMQSKTDIGSLVNGFRWFVETVAKVFKGTKKEVAVNGLTVLIKNASGLFAAAEATRAPSGTGLLSMAATTNTFSTLNIHAALDRGGISTDFSNKLSEMLEAISQKLHGPFGSFKAAIMENTPKDAIDVWGQALANGIAPFASSVMASPFQVSEQEAHTMDQIEATMREVLSSPDAASRTIYKELNKLYREMEEALQPSDFADPKQYEFLFKVERDGTGRSNHLAKFAAFGLANEQVNKLLQRPTKTKTQATQKTFADRMQNLLETVLEYFHERFTKTFAGQAADQKLQQLVTQLVGIEAQRRAAMQRKDFLAGITEPTEEGVRKLTDAIGQRVRKAAGSPVIRNSRFAPVRAAGSMTRIFANDQVEQFMSVVADYRNKNWDQRLGFVAGTLNYMISGNKHMEALLRFRKTLEGQRKDTIEGLAKMVRDAFADPDMDRKDSSSLTRVFLRSGMHHLLGQFDLNDIGSFIADKSARDQAVAQLEQQLSGFGRFKEHFINKANALAVFKATGVNQDPILMMNAGNIARLLGTAYKDRFTGEQLQLATQTIEKLIALYTLDYTSIGDLNRAKKVLDTENQRSNGNGIEFILAQAKRMGKEAKESLFDGQETLMQHGYTPDITNPHVSLAVANAEEGKRLIDLGYVMVGSVPKDPSDPNKEAKSLYAMRDGGLSPLLTGVMAYGDLSTKGSTRLSGMLDPRTATGLKNSSELADILSEKTQQNGGLALGPKKPFNENGQRYMAPVLNPNGDIVNWRYMMEDKTRDSAAVLERDNRIDRVLGVYAGSTFDKLTTTETNVKALEALKEQYLADGFRNPKNYTLIGPKSPNKEDRDTWAMLPQETRDAAIKIWGENGMYVNHGMRDIVFGYRKLSLADSIQRTYDRRAKRPIQDDTQVQKMWDDLFTGLVEHMLSMYAKINGIPDPEAYKQRAMLKVTQFERGWQEVVKETKSLLVVKTITTLIGNVRSNISLLVLSGVPLKDMLRDHLVALRGATAYQKDSEELARLEVLLASGLAKTDEAKMRRQVELLKDAMARNPVKRLIDAGLMPAIVEEVDTDQDDFSYKSKLTRKVDGYTSKVHPMIKAAAKQVYMTKDTKPYQLLFRATQLSDFMARYTQYQHLISRSDNRLSHEDAIQQASDDFVNYDIPMQRGLQYLDEMGIFMFSRYYLRIQKVIMRLFREKPGRVLAAIGLGQFVSLGPIVLDSSWIHKFGNNPIGMGALAYPGSLDELATVSAAGALVK